MLHELLFALNGHPGDIFILTDKNEIEVTSVIPFFHPAEKEILNRICRVASLHYRIKDFSENPNKYLKYNENNSPLFSHGLYMKAFCDGIVEVLQPYRKVLLQLERDILNDSHLTALYVQVSIDEFYILFSYLIRLIDDIVSKEVYGCQILGVIYNHCESGVPFVSKALRTIHRACITVMINQLYSFLFHGVIMNPYNEFFVQVYEPEDRKRLSLEVIVEKTKLDNHIKSKSAFIIKTTMVPPYISSKTAETILFIGETIHMFRCNREQFGKSTSPFQHKEEEYSKKLFELITIDEMNFSGLEEVIEYIRDCVSEHLWKLAVENSDLMNHLQALKDLYLLGRGELFLFFLDQTNHLMNESSSTAIEHDIKTEFQMAARSISLSEDLFFKKFRLTFVSNKKKKHRRLNSSGSTSIWDLIGLEYLPSGILQLLFVPDIMEKYNTIFRYLLFVRRVQLDLQQCWALQMSGVHGRVLSHNSSQCQLRSSMAFIVDNLQYYLQVDVLESQYHALLEKIKAVRDFQKIEIAHVAFLNNILMQTFISVSKVLQCLQDFMQLCLSFCKDVKNGVNLKDDELKEYENAFYQRSSSLISVLTLVGAHDVSPHLAQLLLRINFNDYFQSLTNGSHKRGDVNFVC